MNDLQWNPRGADIAPVYAEALTEATPLLQRLGERPWTDDEFYLAGSSALALYIGHRRARGFDFMSAGNRLTPQERRDLLADLLDLDSGTRVETARDGYLFARLSDGTAVRWFYYPYPQVDPEHEIHGVPIASAVDLGLMKLGAIISRGYRKDFFDLYLLEERLPLEVLLERAEDKFGHVRDFPLQALKGLADRSLTIGETDPLLDGPAFADGAQPTWGQVEKHFDAAVRELGRRHVGLEAGHTTTGA